MAAGILAFMWPGFIVAMVLYFVGGRSGASGCSRRTVPWRYYLASCSSSPMTGLIALTWLMAADTLMFGLALGLA